MLTKLILLFSKGKSIPTAITLWIIRIGLLIGLFFLLQSGYSTFTAGFNARFIEPKVSERLRPYEATISALKSDTARLNALHRKETVMRVAYADSLKGDRRMHVGQVGEFQQLIKDLEARRKAEKAQFEARQKTTDLLITELQKGLPPKECYSVGVFGNKMKIIDCPKE